MTVEEIYEQMLATFNQKSGITLDPNSEMAVRFYALASQVYGLHLQNEWTRLQCFPQTAKGEYLDYHAQMRGIERNQPRAATGILRFSISQAKEEDLFVPNACVCMTAGLVRFETTEEATLPSGALFCDVPARAVEASTSGNVPAKMISMMAVPPVGIEFCTNPSAFAGGSEQEQDEDLRQRVLDTYKRMPNGANVSYYEKETLSFDDIIAVNVIPQSRGRGTVDVVIANATGQPAEALRQEIQEYLESQREITVSVQVLMPKTTTVLITVHVKAKEGYLLADVQARVREAIEQYFDGSLLGQSILRAKLGELIYGIEGVENYQIVQPSADINISPGYLPSIATLSVGAL